MKGLFEGQCLMPLELAEAERLAEPAVLLGWPLELPVVQVALSRCHA